MAPKTAQADDTEALIEHFRALPFDIQVNALRQMQVVIEEGANQKRRDLLDQLAQLDALTGRPEPALDSKQAGDGRTGKPAPPKYRSEKNPSITWSGRGADPKWLVAEMAETGKAKEAFLIQTAS